MSTKLPKNELKYWLAFSQITSVGPVRWQRLLDYFGDLKTAWKASNNDLLKAKIDQKTIDEFLEQRNKIDPNLEFTKVEKNKVKIITILDQGYPKLLKEIYSPPPLLYYRGNLNLNNDFTLAVVGSRKITSYGRLVTERIVRQLAQAGLTIISGLALGVDVCAHQATVDCGGKTVAVLGSGIDQIYPATNRRVAEKIITNGGAIVSEFPFGMPPLKQNFPRRNRLISGLSLGTLVTEATEKSGALITTKYSLDQNREVFAVPGNIYNQNSIGTNNLIKLGGKLITTANDILEALNLEQAKEFKAIKEVMPDNETEKVLFDLLGKGELHVDKLRQYARLDISIINSTLSVMEMKGIVKNIGNQTYAKTR
ncbi:MAG: DNA-protecting protein DprA [Parcubacteria group bacterium]|jgi:DNA processing protein|nr:DNA-protecting protein DprA [Parcubacteria group bacterium]|tara:strand:+ start:11808 stop:12911 length:1104 start_codon:yes stop_codon:yes gene_type:complete